MSKSYDYFDISEVDKETWEKICPKGTYRILTTAELLTQKILPEDLVKKFNNVLVVASDILEINTTFYMVNGNRVDQNAGQIDQQPFGFAFVDDLPSFSGILVQHGNWNDRSTPPPNDFWEKIALSGLYVSLPLSEMPISLSGSLSDLGIESQYDAFRDLYSRYHNDIKSDNS
ncbi:hypothetical protein KAU32_06945 [bacterium]|nr:hypothetical protein [bacterium]